MTVFSSLLQYSEKFVKRPSISLDFLLLDTEKVQIYHKCPIHTTYCPKYTSGLVNNCRPLQQSNDSGHRGN